MAELRGQGRIDEVMAAGALQDGTPIRALRLHHHPRGRPGRLTTLRLMLTGSLVHESARWLRPGLTVKYAGEAVPCRHAGVWIEVWTRELRWVDDEGGHRAGAATPPVQRVA